VRKPASRIHVRNRFERERTSGQRACVSIVVSWGSPVVNNLGTNGESSGSIIIHFKGIIRRVGTDIGAQLAFGGVLGNFKLTGCSIGASAGLSKSLFRDSSLRFGGIRVAGGNNERGFRVLSTGNCSSRVAACFFHVEPVSISALSEGDQNENNAEEGKERTAYRNKNRTTRPFRCFFSGQRSALLSAQIRSIRIGVLVAASLVVVCVWPVVSGLIRRSDRLRHWRFLRLRGSLSISFDALWCVSFCGPKKRQPKREEDQNSAHCDTMLNRLKNARRLKMSKTASRF